MEEAEDDHRDNEQDIEKNAFGVDDNHQMDHRPRKKNKARATLAKVIGGVLLFVSGVFVGANVLFDFASNKNSRKIWYVYNTLKQLPNVSHWVDIYDRDQKVFTMEWFDEMQNDKQSAYNFKITGSDNKEHFGTWTSDGAYFSYGNPNERCTGKFGRELHDIIVTCKNGEYKWIKVTKPITFEVYTGK